MTNHEFTSRGWARELTYSQKFHSRYPAVLLSSKVLHSRQLGQVDLCFVQKKMRNNEADDCQDRQCLREGNEQWQKKIIVVEVKGYYGPAFKQRERLACTCQWLGTLLKQEISLYVVHSKKELLP